jgi:integrase
MSEIVSTKPKMISKRAIARFAEILSHCTSENTKRAYRHAWNGWTRYAKENRLEKFPIDPVDLGVYLTELHDGGRRKSSISQFLSVVRYLHQGRPDPTDHPLVKNLWRGICRKDQRPRDKAQALSIDTLKMICDAMDTKELRDRVILTVGWTAALRASELVALQWDHISFVSRGVELIISHSKTDQEGHGYTIALPYFKPELASICPARALRALHSASNPKPDQYVLTAKQRPTDAPMNRKAIERIVKKWIKVAKLPGDYSAHSLRSGFATWAAEAGVTPRKIKRHGRWISDAVMQGYIQDGTLWIDSPFADLASDNNKGE